MVDNKCFMMLINFFIVGWVMVFGYEDYVSKRMRMDKFSEDLIKLFFLSVVYVRGLYDNIMERDLIRVV